MAMTGIGAVVKLVAGVPATENQAGYEALSFVEVGGTTDVGEYGAQVNVVTYTPLKDGITRKEKGFTNYGALTLKVALDDTDAGQILLKAGSESTSDYSFGVFFDDGSVDYFIGIITSFVKNVAGEAVIERTASIEIKSKIVEVAA